MGRLLMLYDADCSFCTRAAGFAPRLGLRVEARALQTVNLPALGVSPHRAERELPFVDTDGQVLYGHESIARALSTGNPLLRLVAFLMMLWPIRHVAHTLYLLVANNRHRLPGGTAACAIAPHPRTHL